jgi:hypothetical protein
MGHFGQDVTQIAMALISVAFVALLVGHAAAAGSLVDVTAKDFNTLLGTVELQSTASDTPYTPPNSFGGFGSGY